MFKMDYLDNSSAIMEPCDSLTFDKEEAFKPDVDSDGDFTSIHMSASNYDITDISNGRSFLLMDCEEILHVQSVEQFYKLLKCTPKAKMKVVSIFGNAGDGKSHTMNHIFFNGEETFRTSKKQKSCTLGVCAALQPDWRVLCLDTEGLLSTSQNRPKHTRMLLKILAISDVVIYRSRSERLHTNMYDFLGAASKAFSSHFSQVLQSLSLQASAAGPAVIVFHETIGSDLLENSVEKSAEDILRDDFEKLKHDISAFSSLRYVGLQTSPPAKTDYTKLINDLRCALKNTVSSPRTASVIFSTLHALNKKFSGAICENSVNTFSEDYLTCPVNCVSCNRRCQRSMGHEGENHLNSQPCQHNSELENIIEFCKSCHSDGREAIVTRNDGWAYCSIDCPNCGQINKIYKILGNKGPDCDAVRTQTIHIWNDSNVVANVPSHSAQMILDTVSYLCNTVTSIASEHAVSVKEYCADTVAPTYWTKNRELKKCFACNVHFKKYGLSIHHCRGCGQGFCDTCSQHRMAVPGRNWFHLVRVCNDCREELLKNPSWIPDYNQQETTNDNRNNSSHHATVQRDENTAPVQEADVTIRKYSETIYNTFSKVATAAIECTKEIIKDTARPEYWVPDAEAIRCHICKILFGTADELALARLSSDTPQSTGRLYQGGDCRRHHCRKCGQGVCSPCSKARRPVPDRGWKDKVRVCDECVKDMAANATKKESSVSSPN